MSNYLCDFCSEPNVAWSYPTKSFLAYVAADIAGQSVGDWAACRTCHDLIESGDRSALLERSLQTLLQKNPEMRAAEVELRGQIAQFHQLFYANQTGAAVCA